MRIDNEQQFIQQLALFLIGLDAETRGFDLADMPVIVDENNKTEYGLRITKNDVFEEIPAPKILVQENANNTATVALDIGEITSSNGIQFNIACDNIKLFGKYMTGYAATQHFAGLVDTFTKQVVINGQHLSLFRTGNVPPYRSGEATTVYNKPVQYRYNQSTY